MQPDACSVDSLSAFPFLAMDLQSLKAELPTYFAQATDVDPSIDPLEWWKQHASSLPNWASAACKVFLVQPPSATSERVFFLLRASFGEQQDSTLQDYVETSLMLQYNSQ